MHFDHWNVLPIYWKHAVRSFKKENLKMASHPGKGIHFGFPVSFSTGLQMFNNNISYRSFLL